MLNFQIDSKSILDSNSEWLYVRFFPTLLSKIKWLESEVPLKFTQSSGSEFETIPFLVDSDLSPNGSKVYHGL